jgi:cytosol aminopeptidase
MLRRVQLRFPLPAPLLSLRQMATSAYVLLHQPGTSATVDPTISGVDQSKLLSKLPKTEKPPKVGDTKIFYDTPEGKVTALVSLGDKFTSKQSNEQRELVRRAVGSAVKKICDIDGVNRAEIDVSTDPQAAGEYPHPITVR